LNVIEAMKKYEILYNILVPAFTRTKTSVWLRGILWFLWHGVFHVAILFSHTAENTAQLCRFLILIETSRHDAPRREGPRRLAISIRPTYSALVQKTYLNSWFWAYKTGNIFETVKDRVKVSYY